MLKFLNIPKQGIDMNLIAYQCLTHIYWPDSCPFGLGGYWNKGFAWRFEIVEDLQFWVSKNILKYMASIIFSVARHDGRPSDPKDNCALSMTDSSTSAGWLHKTNFYRIIGKEAGPVKAKFWIKIAPHHVAICFAAGIKEYSQWFAGSKNNVADSLSQDFDCTNDKLTHILHDTCPSQLPKHFLIVLLPSKISSWPTSLL